MLGTPNIVGGPAPLSALINRYMRCTAKLQPLYMSGEDQLADPELLAPRRWVSPWLAGTAALTALIFLSVFMRANAYSSGLMLNPDEAELLAEGRRATLDIGRPYGAATATTHTWLWPLLLGVLGRAGIPLDFTTAHVLAGGFYVWVAWVSWMVIFRTYGWWLATILVFPASAVVLGLEGDFHSLGTELLPVAVIFLALLVFLLPQSPPSRSRLFLTAALLGLAVWAKPQLGLLAVCLLIFAWYVASSAHQKGGLEPKKLAQSWIHNAAPACAGFLLPTVGFVIWMLATGTWSNFVNEPIGFQYSYLVSREAMGGASPGLISRFSLTSSFVLTFWTCLLGAFAAGLVWFSRDSKVGERDLRRQLIIWVSILSCAFLTLLFSFPLFNHYANVLFAAGLAAGIMIVGSCKWYTSSNVTPATVSPAFLVPVTLISALLIVSLLPVVQANFKGIASGKSSATEPRWLDDNLARMCPAGSNVLVWGWSSELYAYYDWMPASRYVNSVWQILPSLNLSTYQQTMAEELRADPPKCIVDTAESTFFGNLSTNESLSQRLPQVSPLLSSCYSLATVSMADGRSVNVYERVGTCET